VLKRKVSCPCRGVEAPIMCQWRCSSRGFYGFLVHFLRGQNNPRNISILPGLPDSENGGNYIRRNVGNYTPNGGVPDGVRLALLRNLNSKEMCDKIQ